MVQMRRTGVVAQSPGQQESSSLNASRSLPHCIPSLASPPDGGGAADSAAFLWTPLPHQTRVPLACSLQALVSKSLGGTRSALVGAASLGLGQPGSHVTPKATTGGAGRGRKQGLRSSRPAPKHSRALGAPKLTARGEPHSPAVKRTDTSETSCVRLRLQP